jgi:large subunit ribosomal protein L7/L12
MADITKEDVIEWLSGQSVLEIAGLVKDLEEKWGVSAAAPVAAVAAVPGAGDEAAGEAAEEQTEFDVVLKSFGSNKIAVIKEVRALLVSASRKPRNWSKAPPRPSRKRRPRTMPKTSRRNSKPLELKSKSSNADRLSGISFAGRRAGNPLHGAWLPEISCFFTIAQPNSLKN